MVFLLMRGKKKARNMNSNGNVDKTDRCRPIV
jgi:hypothetical protein